VSDHHPSPTGRPTGRLDGRPGCCDVRDGEEIDYQDDNVGRRILFGIHGDKRLWSADVRKTKEDEQDTASYGNQTERIDGRKKYCLSEAWKSLEGRSLSVRFA